MAWEFMSTYLGVRSRFFDEFLGSAAAAGLDQVVLLAAGLDTRAFRLGWQPGTTVYELDAPKVLQFKDRVLTEQRAQPRCQRRTVAVDLREDWPAAVSTARAVEIAQRYRRPLDEMALQPMQSSVLVTARAEGQRVQQATGG
jgi:methyltransferase (TIGR00027 family)